MKRRAAALMTIGLAAGMTITGGRTASAGAQAGTAQPQKPDTKNAANARRAAPTGTPVVWEDRGSLTPAQVFWGEASRGENPQSRLPALPLTWDGVDAEGTSPKCRVRDKNRVRWTVKFGEEAHSDVAAPRLAWALGFETDESYHIKTGKIEGVTQDTDLGKCRPYIDPLSGVFSSGRFKRNDGGKHVKTASAKPGQPDEDATWDERKNPGLPPEQLSGLLILEVMTHNWDAQPKNNKIIGHDGANGPQLWYEVSDWGASFGQMRSKGNLSDYEKETSFVRSVDANTVTLKYESAIKAMAPVHEKIPLAHAQWFRKQLEKLTDADLRAAFEAGYATDEAYKAYASGTPADASTFNALTNGEIAGYVKAFRAKIEEFKNKVK